MQKEVLKCRLRQLEQQVVESYEGWKKIATGVARRESNSAEKL